MPVSKLVTISLLIIRCVDGPGRYLPSKKKPNSDYYFRFGPLKDLPKFKWSVRLTFLELHIKFTIFPRTKLLKKSYSYHLVGSGDFVEFVNPSRRNFVNLFFLMMVYCNY